MIMFRFMLIEFEWIKYPIENLQMLTLSLPSLTQMFHSTENQPFANSEGEQLYFSLKHLAK